LADAPPMFAIMRVFKRILLSCVFAAVLASCGGSGPPTTDFSSTDDARESFDLVTESLSDTDRSRVIDALAWALLTNDGKPEAAPGTREHGAFRSEVAAFSDVGIIERLSAAGFDGLSGPALMERAREKIEQGVGIEMARTGIALDEARQPVTAYRTAADTLRTTLSPLSVTNASIDRGVIHQSDRARVRATVENRFDTPVVRLYLKAAIQDPEAGLNAEARFAIRLDRPLLPGRRATVDGYGGLGDGIDGDLAAQYAGQRHRNALSVVAERVEFDDGTSIDGARPPAPGDLARIDRIRQRHDEWIDRYRLARDMKVDWSADDDEDAESESDDENGEGRPEPDLPPTGPIPAEGLSGISSFPDSPNKMTNIDTREFIKNEIT